jgi:hypothetical protein
LFYTTAPSSKSCRDGYDVVVSKKFKGRPCVYCSTSASDTVDHVFAQEFFLPEHQQDLPKVPACGLCNNKKSWLEHYLISVLPFGGRDAEAAAALRSRAPRRLAKNRKLQRQLASTVEPTWVREGGGLFQPTFTIVFDGLKLEEYLRYVARGLAWHHWKTYLCPEDDVKVMFLPEAPELQRWFRNMDVARRISNSLGSDAVQYEGVQATESVQQMVWVVSMYGGVQLSMDGREVNLGATLGRWWIMTGPPEIAARWEAFRLAHERIRGSISSL